MESLLGKSEKQERTNGYPNLRIDCVLRGTIEGLDMKMLFDPFEEEFDVPTLAIEFRNGEGVVSHVVGQESVDGSIGEVFVSDQPKFLGIAAGGFVGSQLDDFVSQNTGVQVDRSGSHDVVFDVVLGSCHEESAVAVNAVEQPEEVDVALVQQIDGPHLNAEVIQHLDIVYGCFRKMHEDRKITAEVELRMHLDAGLGRPEFGPWAEFQTETDRAAVKSVDGIVQVKPERIVGIQGTDFVNEDLSEISVDAPVAEFVGFCQRIPGDRIADATHIQFVRNGRQTCLNVPKTALVRILGQAHYQELVVARKIPDTIVPVIAGYAVVELSSGDKGHNLSKHCTSLVHCGWDFGLCRKSIVSNPVHQEIFINR